MAVSEQIVSKIQKLLALATSPNEHEAASAAAKAQALMLEHDLAMEQVEGMKVDPRLQGITEAERVVLRKAGKPGGWKIKLFEVVGKTCDCWASASDAHGKWYDGTGQLIGRTQDVQMAHYIFDFLVRELERLQDAYGKERWAELREYAKREGITTHDAEREYKHIGKHPLKSKNSWIIGASEAVASNLYQAQRERNNTAGANDLVVSKQAMLNDYFAVKRGYKSYADFLEKMQARTVTTVDGGALKRLTKREIESMAAQQRRAQRRADTADRNKWNAMDHAAYRRGQDEGGRIAVRPGLEPKNSRA